MNNYIKEIRELLERNHNVILTGAPGTGKTFLAREVAKSMNAEYDFVQFHPSYDYTDFVEGLRPVAGTNGSLGFERKDGVFKVFCKKTLSNFQNDLPKEAQETTPIEVVSANSILSIKNELPSFYELYAELKRKIQSKNVILYTVYPRSQMELQVSGNDVMYNKGGTFTSNYINEDYVQKIFNYYRDRNISDITRVPFKDFCEIIGNTLNYTYYRGIVQELLSMNQKKCNESDHQVMAKSSLNYKERVDLSQFQHKDILPIQDTSFVSKNNIVQEKSSRRYVFIIDEINRGEISKIFGELFFSIDPGYRGKKGTVKTQYQNLITDKNDPFYDGFYIPDNVYIIGTMNDIDRSVESMDFAMRRRFAWKEIKANENTGMLDNTLGELKAEAVATMERLNNAIWNEETNEGIDGLSAAYHIGGAYFLKLKLYLDEGLSKEEAYRKLWENHLRGLLFEYLRGSMDADSKLKELEKTYYFG